MDTKHTEIHFQLSLFGARIELATYNEVARQLQIALQEHERTITGKPAHAEWVIDTTAVIPVSAAPNGTSEEDLRAVVRETWQGFARAVSGRGDDVAFAERTKSQAAIDSILAQLGEDLEALVVSGDDLDDLTIDRSSIVSGQADGARQPAVADTTYEDIATLDGVIDLLSMRRKVPYFSLREHWTGRFIAASCDDPALLHLATTALESQRRVEVTGTVKFRASGEPLSIREITHIWWAEADPDDILTYEGVLPNLTGGMDEGEYVRELRSGEYDE